MSAVLTMCSLLLAAAAPQLSVADTPPTWLSPRKVAVFSVIANSTGLKTTVGTVSKHPECSPCWNQTEPWEMRLDNGYPNVVYDPTDPFGAFRAWYGGCVNGCGHQFLLYANSTDGLHWTKPQLGLLNLTDFSPQQFKDVGTANNVVIYGGGLGVYKDPHEPDPSKRFKASGGTMCPISGGCPTGRCSGCLAGTATSADGFEWASGAAIDWPAPQRYDCHTNMFWDSSESRYVITTRDYDKPQGREIALSQSGSGVFGGWSSPTTLVESGTPSHQLYSQITFPYANIYLGIVMIFDAESSAGHVHCRLSWSRELSHGWAWVDPESPMPGTEFIPAGPDGAFDSHVCFAAAHPIQSADSVRIYYMGGNGPHSGARNSSFAMATLRTDGFVGVQASGNGSLITTKLNVTGPTLVLSADVAAGGMVAVGAIGEEGLDLGSCVPCHSDITSGKVQFLSERDFSGLVGKTVSLEFRMLKAVVYTVGFE